MKVYFVVLNWKTKELTKQCVISIQKLVIPQGIQVKTILVDNGSHDGSIEYLREWFGTDPNIIIQENFKNLGFAGGQDSVREIVSEGDYVALVNSDAVLEDAWLVEILAVAQTSAEIAALGGKAYDWDGGKEKGRDGFYSYQVIDPYEGFAHTLRYGEKIQDVDGISGAALMLRVKPALEVGYFDPEFFCYYEETDLIARLKRTGHRCVYVPQAHAWHMIAASSSTGESNQNTFYQHYMHRNRLFFVYKNFDKPYLRKFFWRYFLQFINNICSKTSLKKKVVHEFTVFSSFIQSLGRLQAQRAAILKSGSYNNLLISVDKPTDVSVIIPCFNHGKHLAAAIQSVINQTHQPKKIILVNDGSTDDSLAIMHSYAAGNPGMIDVIDQGNSGVVIARNKALQQVSTFWTIFLDADDTLKKDYIEKTVAAARREGASVVYTDAILFDRTGAEKRQTYRKYSKAALWEGNFIHNSALIETRFIKEVGGYKEIMAHGLEDWELFISLSEKTQDFYYLEEPLLMYRQDFGVGRNNHAEIYLPILRQVVQNLHKDYFVSRLKNLQIIAEKILFLPTLAMTIIASAGYTFLKIWGHWTRKSNSYTQRIIEKFHF